MQHYEKIIKRLFAENGYEVDFKQLEQTLPDPG
jgi:hypothetical protein